MTKSKQTLIAWLRDAHAMERASVDSLDRMADRLARFPDLAAGLRERKLSGAGLDVFEHEPAVPDEYLDLPNVVLSPHVAWYSEEASQQLRTSAVRTIADFLTGKPAVNVVN